MHYTFGSFEFDAGTGELQRSGRLVALEPQPARALGFLISRAGEIVSRERLAQHVWGSEATWNFIQPERPRCGSNSSETRRQ
jgi:DNA-binding winged helix-turn-helix (wHTH) protein